MNLLVSLALLSVKHFVAFNMAEVAHVADISECKVVVEASLAGPVTNSLLDLLGDNWGGFGCAAMFLWGLDFLRFGFVGGLLEESLLFELGSLVW